MGTSPYLNVLASHMHASAVKSWVIVILAVVTTVLSIILYMTSTQPVRVLAIPGAAPGFYTAGSDVPIDVIISHAKGFANSLTNYDSKSFAYNVNEASKMMTPACRMKKKAEINEWLKAIKRFNMSKSFHIAGDPKVVSENPFTLEFKGDFFDRNASGKAVLEGVQTLRLMLKPEARTHANYLGYAVDDWEIIRRSRRGE